MYTSKVPAPGQVPFVIFYGRRDKTDSEASCFERMRFEIGTEPEPLILGCDGKDANYDHKIDLDSLVGRVCKIKYLQQGFGFEINQPGKFYSEIAFLDKDGNELAKMASHSADVINKWVEQDRMFIVKAKENESHMEDKFFYGV